MSNVTYVKGDELTALAKSLKSKGENILNTYKVDCSQAIQLSSECLQISGLSSANFLEALEKIYTQVNNRLVSFADFLTNVVVQEYTAVSEAIVNNFNSNFANEMSGLLGITVAVGLRAAGPVTATTIVNCVSNATSGTIVTGSGSPTPNPSIVTGSGGSSTSVTSATANKPPVTGYGYGNATSDMYRNYDSN